MEDFIDKHIEVLNTRIMYNIKLKKKTFQINVNRILRYNQYFNAWMVF